MIPSHSLVQIPPATRSNNSVTLDDVNRKVTLHGWLEMPNRKVSKGFRFLILRDTKGNVIQLSCSNDIVPRNILSESTVAVTGILDLRPEGQRREGLGRFEVKVDKIHLLNNVGFVLPFQPSQSNNVNLVTRAKYRYLELRNPLNHSYLRLRDDVIASCRQFLRTNGFMEIETPLLFKSTPEGAREFIVPTRRKGEVYALPQSPQQYKQILMASGISKYFQVAKCFRDESLRADRQPEFTQVLLLRKKLISSWIWRWHSLGVRR
jgi:aspartyl-tRNA synthetase